MLAGCLLFGGATASSSARDAHAEVAVLPLQNRPAAEILPELQGLFGEAATLRADGFRLLVRADAQTLEQIRNVVTELDLASRDLILSVRRSSERPRQETGAALDIESGPDGTRAQGTARRWTTARHDDQTQQVRLREGTEAVILVGETEAHGFRVFAGRAGVGMEPLFRDTARGFRVQPHAQPDGRIRVDIFQLHEQPPATTMGRVERQAVESSITIQPGAWHELAGVGRTLNLDERGIASRRTSRARDALSLQIRVDPID
ncbi:MULTISPECIES: secretin N-terminal domain-containing protein [unclassified Thioalkalivibrio]|uniref:secretin N-terminal domain-containing protein n=1 Tax=unclassified Thioalkalivibrio TaxID=2621013 RepID=UPI00036A06D2|nr:MULTISPECIES: secretin N-terminal domain-containing protein [unclassified Thioalkalivibrio]